MPGEHILIVDDERAIRTTLRGVIDDEGYRVTAGGSGQEATRIQEETPDIIFLDIWMPGIDGLDTLAEMKRVRPETAVVMISGHGTIETAVKATKLGAYDFIEKPLSLEKTLLIASRALDHTRLERENRTLRAQLERGQEIVGKSPLIEHLRQQMAIAAPSSGRVLIQGENGSGKELVARAIHALSARRDGPFVEVNCAAIPEELIESELFGHERGAFTGAVARRRGKFELADQGTLFLDEIGDMSLKTQAKVLRALEEQAFERVGGKDTIRVDVRVLAASTRTCPRAHRGGGSARTLLPPGIIPIEEPPPASGREVPALVAHFGTCSRPRTAAPVSVEAPRVLLSYDWRATCASCATWSSGS
jgi:two-component system nitrogen regulation response regulator NtrX